MVMMVGKRKKRRGEEKRDKKLFIPVMLCLLAAEMPSLEGENHQKRDNLFTDFLFWIEFTSESRFMFRLIRQSVLGGRL